MGTRPDWVLPLLFAAAIAFVVGGVTIMATGTVGLAGFTVGFFMAFLGLVFLVAALVVSELPRMASQAIWRALPAPKLQIGLTEVAIPAAQDRHLNHRFNCKSRAETGRVVSINPGLSQAVAPHLPRETRVPTRLVFSRPRRTVIRSTDLPAVVHGKRGDMEVYKFIPGGFVMNDGPCSGDEVAGELFFD